MGVKERKIRHKENLRQAILDAARELFVTEGYENTSIRKIADKIEYTPPIIYAHFKDKADLLDSICEETFSKLDLALQKIQRQELDPIECLRKGAKKYIEVGLKNPSHYMVTFILKDDRIVESELHNKKMLNGMRCFNNLRQMMTRVQNAQGVTAPEDIEAASQAMWAGIHGITALLVTQKGFPFIEQKTLIERTINMLIDGIRKR